MWFWWPVDWVRRAMMWMKKELAAFFNASPTSAKKIITISVPFLKPGLCNWQKHTRHSVWYRPMLCCYRIKLAPRWDYGWRKTRQNLCGDARRAGWNDVHPAWRVDTRLRNQRAGLSCSTQPLCTVGYGETDIALRIEPLLKDMPEYISIAYLSAISQVRLRLTGIHHDEQLLKTHCMPTPKNSWRTEVDDLRRGRYQPGPWN